MDQKTLKVTYCAAVVKAGTATWIRYPIAPAMTVAPRM